MKGCRVVLFLSFLLVLFGACTNTKTLSLKPQEFGVPVSSLLWFNIPGMNEDHLLLLKKNKNNVERPLSFEDFTCFGKTWDFNFYESRPKALQNLLTQFTGQPNINESCSVYSQAPFWKRLSENGTPVIVLDISLGESANSTFFSGTECQEEKKKFFGSALTILSRPRSPQEELTMETLNYKGMIEKLQQQKSTGIIFDKTLWFHRTSSSEGPLAILDFIREIQKISEKYVLIVKDSRYQEYLERKQIKEALEILDHYEKLSRSLLSVPTNFQLVLVNSSHSYPLSVPLEMTQPKKQSTKEIPIPVSFSSPIWAYGASAENFCGGPYFSEDLWKRLPQPRED